MQLNEIHDTHEHASVSLKVILLVFAVILVGVLGYLVWDFNNTPDTTDYSSTITKKTETTQTEETDETASWETYTNSLLGFSIKYPNTLGVYTLGGEGPDSPVEAATNTSDYLFISSGTETGGKLYATDATSIGNLSENTIKQQFIDSATLTISNTLIDSTPAYKVVVENDPSVLSTFYFVKNASTGKIIKLTVINNDSVSSSIFESFNFTK